MKTRIVIIGQMSGNHILKSQIGGYSEIQRRFTDYVLTFDSLKLAKLSLKLAYEMLSADEPEIKDKMSGVRISANGKELYYDASKAVIF
jgi:hypothetical protein